MSSNEKAAIAKTAHTCGDKLPAFEIAADLGQAVDFKYKYDFCENSAELPHTLLDFQELSGVPAKAKNRRGRKPRKSRGWRSTTGLKWKEVKEISKIARMAEEAGFTFNLFVSVSPPDAYVSDSARKRACYKLEGNFSDRLKRRGSPFLAVRVFEKRSGGLLHMHLMVHVPESLLNEVISWSNAVTNIKIRESHHISYITKQRHPQHPDFERIIRHQRQKGSAFKGRRWSLSRRLSFALGL
jgi:hypothetical protein